MVCLEWELLVQGGADGNSDDGQVQSFTCYVDMGCGGPGRLLILVVGMVNVAL